MKPRELEQELRRVGAVLEKKDGDHHVWRLPNGSRFDVPTGGKHNREKPYLVAKLKRLLRENDVTQQRTVVH